MAMVHLILLAAVATGTAAAPAPDPMLDRAVEEVYVPPGDVLDFLPELLLQLDIPAAGIDLGRIFSRQYFVKDARPGGPWPDICVTRQERQIAAIEFKRGTVRQVLDELVRRRPELSWQDQGGVLLITSTAGKGSLVQPALDCRLPHFKADNQPMDRAVVSVEEVVDKAQPAVAEAISWTMMQWRFHPVLEPRQPLDVPVTLDRANVTARRLLSELVRQAPGAFWTAYDEFSEEPEDQMPGRRFGEIAISRITDVRRALNLDTLVQCLDSAHAPLHGYASQKVRIEDAKRELSRRSHFHPDDVRQALLKPDCLLQMIQGPKTVDASGLLQWACGLGDPKLKAAIVELIPTIKDTDRRYECFLGFTVTTTEVPELQRYMPLWKRMLDDPDPRIRERAQEVIDWSNEAPEAKP